MSLIGVEEVLVIGRDAAGAAVRQSRRARRPGRSTGHARADGVVKRGIRQAHVTLAVEPDAVQLQLEVVVAVARGVEHDARSFVDLHEPRDLE